MLNYSKDLLEDIEINLEIMDDISKVIQTAEGVAVRFVSDITVGLFAHFVIAHC